MDAGKDTKMRCGNSGDDRRTGLVKMGAAIIFEDVIIRCCNDGCY